MAGSDINRTIVIGRLVRAPELRYTPSGAQVANFSIANNRAYTVNGEKREQVYFFNCIAWNKLAEIIAQYCKKGQRIGIEGHLQQRTWEDSGGSRHSAVEIVVDNFNFLSSTKREAAPSGPAAAVADEFEGMPDPNASLDNTIQYDGEF